METSKVKLFSLAVTALAICASCGIKEQRTVTKSPKATTLAPADGTSSGSALDLPPDDGLVAAPVPAPGDPGFLDYQQVCGLGRMHGYSAEVIGGPAKAQPSPAPRKDGNAVLRIEIASVVANERGAVLPPQIDVLVSARDNVRFKGSGVTTVWPSLRGPNEHLLLSLSPDPAAPWYLMVVRAKPSGLDFVPDACDTTASFAKFARQANRENSFELMRALHTEQMAYEACAAKAGGSPCTSELLQTADTAQFGPASPVEDPAARWRNTDPSNRSLVFSEVDPVSLNKLLLVPISVVNSGKPDDRILTLSCSLGIGYRWGGLAPVLLPASACRAENLRLTIGPADGGSKAEIVTIPEAVLNETLGIELKIDWATATPSASFRTLKPGELEKILGVTSAQLSELRAQYTQPMKRP
jgi:hypothetical protein